MTKYIGAAVDRSINMALRTPGPWWFIAHALLPDHKGLPAVCADAYDADGKPQSLYMVTEVYGQQHKPGSERANASLIAAAPTMYDYVVAKALLGDKEAQDIVERIASGIGFVNRNCGDADQG